MAESTVGNMRDILQLRRLTTASGISGNGTYPLNVDFDAVHVVVFQLSLSSAIRQTIVVSHDDVAAGYCFPDAYIAQHRMYMQVTLSGNSFVVTQFTRPSEISPAIWIVKYM